MRAHSIGVKIFNYTGYELPIRVLRVPSPGTVLAVEGRVEGNHVAKC